MTDTYDPDLLVTFLAVAETGSFSEAARRRGLRQSTVSQHVRRLEAETRRRLFDRDTHNVSLTVDGQALTVLAGEILAAYSRAERYFSNAELRGRVRFGASEDFALSSLLPQVLRAFSSRHPQVDIEMTVGLAADLYGRMDEGALDLIFAKRRAGDGRGRMVWREEMVWIAAPDWRWIWSARCRSSSIRRTASPARPFSRRLRKRTFPGASPAPAARFPAWSAPSSVALASARNRRVSSRKGRSPSGLRPGCHRSARRNSWSSPRAVGGEDQ
jgi:DNA-binding transcriptional LysR family regulator